MMSDMGLWSKTGFDCLLLLLLLFLAKPNITRADDLAQLRQSVKDHPEDVDLRFYLANYFWRIGELDQARAEAVVVVQRAPGYVDAQLLISRIDGVKGNFDQAFARVEAVLRVKPELLEALRLKADLGLWSGRHDLAVSAVDRMAEIDLSADIHYRRAQIAYNEMRYLTAYREAELALAFDPNHRQSHQLRENTHFFQMDAVSEFEFFPAYEPSHKKSFAETLSFALLPRNKFNGAMDYEYRYRFATHNHRFALRLNLRLTREWTISVYGRVGVVSVLPWLTGIAETTYAFKKGYLGIRYTVDQMKWPGRLQRIQLGGSWDMSAHIRAESSFDMGFLRHCGKVADPMFGPRVRLWGIFPPVESYIQYAYGMEFGRSEKLIENQCPSDHTPVDVGLPSVEMLDETRYQEIAAFFQYNISRQMALKSGYTLQLRNNGTEAHLCHLGLRLWL